ncbi:MAG TPA: hypothetical protein PKY25_01550 [Bacilli bacterium]|nr:hypothetical protein [Bacilli bacterium]
MNRDYNFNDEQVVSLGFSSYEELEKYYDLLFDCSFSQIFTKEMCQKEVQGFQWEDRLKLSRAQRISTRIMDLAEVLNDFAESGIVEDNDIKYIQKLINKRIEMLSTILQKENFMSAKKGN